MCEFHISRRAFGLGLMVSALSALVLWPSPTYAQSTPDGGPPILEQIVPNLRSQTGFFGLATITVAGPVIYYDAAAAQALDPWSQAFFRFIRAHEYGHHRRGHMGAFIMGQGNPFAMPWINHAAELEADCYAAIVLRANGDMQAIAAAMQAYQQLLFPHSFPGMPGSVQRTQNIQACAQ